ncbi:LLM class flavin-dependent oxidoreductase [Mycolicibacterium wolinskyi]|uniref:LLM class flavin-dependent oxidoreductase n=1 Tax=Mycolicibacterium wolinskyi TaxID=59750 RepID=UPI003917AA81
MTLRLGFLTHVTSGRTPAESLHIALDLFQAADELGYDTGWVAQHRFGDPDGSLPTPLTFLAAAAATTSRINLGTAVVVLPTDDPIALAEQVYVVDQISGGRVELGVGTGGHVETFAAVGADISHKQTAFTEKLSTLTSVLRGDPINATTARLHSSAAAITGRIWESTTSTAGAQRTGRNGNGLLLARSVYFSDTATDEHQLPVVTQYRDALTDAAPRIGVSRTVYPAADRRTSTADLADGLNRYVAQMVREGHFPANRSTEDYFCRSLVHHGHPDEVVESLVADLIVPHATELICQTAPGTVHPDKVLAALELTAVAVAPQLQQRLVDKRPAVTP